MTQQTAGPAQRGTPGTHHECQWLHDGKSARFVKWAGDLGRRRGLERERFVHRTLTTRSPGLRGVLVPLIASSSSSLTYEAVEGSDLGAAATTGGGALAAAVGDSVGRLHALGPTEAMPLAVRFPFERIHKPDPVTFSQLSAGGIEVVRLIQRSESLCTAMDALPQAERTHFVHGDLRWENIMVGKDPPGCWNVRLVDWETGGLGDPHWDLGCLVGDALAVWTAGGAASGVDGPGRSLDAVQPAEWIGALLSAYRWWRPECADAEGEFTRRIFQAAGLRLIGSVLEAVAVLPRVPRIAAVNLQLAANILADPRGAVAAFSGTRR